MTLLIYILIGQTSSKNKFVYSSGSSVYTITTKVLKTGIKLCKNWDLTIDLKIPNQPIKHWTNIFGIQQENSVNMQTGSRLPALQIHEKHKIHGNAFLKHSLYLNIASEIGNDPNYEFELIKWDPDRWTNLKISQISGLFKIEIDGKEYKKVQNPTPKEWNNVKIVMGNLYLPSKGWYYTASKGEYKNFKLRTCF